MRNFYQEALSEVKLHMTGLPGFCRLAIYDLLKYCDYKTGVISIKTLEEVASNDFYVAPCSGRKKEAITADKLRNAFRTIKNAKPDHFKFTNVNQRIVIEMPFLRELYEEFQSKTPEVSAVLATDVATQETLNQTGEEACFDSLLSTDVAEDLAAASSNAAINVRVKETKTNKQTKTNLTDEFVSNFKQGIADDFTPSQSLINTALARGLEKVTDFAEIKKFVLYNQAKCTKWVDYEPIFLAWLERDAEHERAALSRAEQIKNQQKKSMGAPYECHRYKTKTSDKTTQSREFVRGRDDIKVFSDNNGFGEEYQLVVGSNECNVRETFHIGSRCP
jgi:hypothetical protein